MTAPLSPDALRVARMFDFTPQPEPMRFATPEAAWFWAMQTLMARRDGDPAPDPHGIADTIVKAVDRLYRQRRLDLAHARVLRVWGEQQCQPTRAADWRLWSEAMLRLGERLRALGVVVRA